MSGWNAHACACMRVHARACTCMTWLPSSRLAGLLGLHGGPVPCTLYPIPCTAGLLGLHGGQWSLQPQTADGPPRVEGRRADGAREGERVRHPALAREDRVLLSGGGEGAHRWLSSSASTSAAISPSVLALATTPLAASLAAPSAPCTLYPVPSASSASAASASAPSQLAAASRPSPSHPMCSSSTLRASAFQEAAASSAVDSPRPLPSMRMGFVRSAEGLALLAASPTALPSVLSILERVATCSVGLMAFASVLVQRPHTPSVLSALSEAILRELRPLRTMLWSVDAQASDAQRALAAAMHACVHTHMHMCMHTKHIRTGERCSEGARGRPAATRTYVLTYLRTYSLTD